MSEVTDRRTAGVVVRRVGTDDRANRWLYQYMGSPSAPFGFTTTWPALGTWLAIAVPLWVVFAVAFQWLAIPLIVISSLPVTYATRWITRRVTRDRPLKHHVWVLRSEVHGQRRQPAQVTETALDRDVMEFIP